MADKKHILFETVQGVEITVQTAEKYPETVWLHITGRGFSYCAQFTEKEARHMGMAFLDAMDEVAAHEQCGKVCSGVACTMPKGSKCPDCGPAAIDYPAGE